jgi:hypothetical protein
VNARANSENTRRRRFGHIDIVKCLYIATKCAFNYNPMAHLPPSLSSIGRKLVILPVIGDDGVRGNEYQMRDLEG